MTAISGGFFRSLPAVSRQLQIVSLTLLFSASTCIAQPETPAAKPPGSSSSQAGANPQSQPMTITIPAGTHLALALTHPVDSRTTHRGDEIFAQTTSPLIVSSQVAIPAGTFVQGKVDKMNRRGTHGELLMQSLSIVFPNGYVASINGPLNMETEEGTAFSNPSSAEKAGIIAAPLAGLGIGAAIGAAQHTTMSSTLGGTTFTESSLKGVSIGSLVGLAAGGVVSMVLLTRSHHFYLEEGSPAELSLPQAVTLAQIQISNPDDTTASTPVPPSGSPASPRPASAMHGTCYIPGRPGTPPTYIPGTPGTEDSPGTTGTYIPGTPPTPPIPYPCP